jgi:hypothetical protein
MSQEYPEEELGKGSIELKSQNLTIDYREHPTRNGKPPRADVP